VGNRDPRRHVTHVRTTGWAPSCRCAAGAPVPCTILDPFAGSSTTGLVAISHGRSFVDIELNPEYVEISKRRLAQAYDREVLQTIIMAQPGPYWGHESSYPQRITPPGTTTLL
jgi:hypothetical protein